MDVGICATYDERMIYLDHNATTPVVPEVLGRMMPYLSSEWGNPSPTYKFGSKLKGVVEAARQQVAELIGAQARELIFTSCATESNNAAIHAAFGGHGQGAYRYLTGRTFVGTQLLYGTGERGVPGDVLAGPVGSVIQPNTCGSTSAAISSFDACDEGRRLQNGGL